MKIKFKVFGFPALSKVLGANEVMIAFDGRTINNLLDHLAVIYGPEVDPILRKDGNGLRPGIRLLHNRSRWIQEDDLETELNDGDEIVLSLFVTGG